MYSVSVEGVSMPNIKENEIRVSYLLQLAIFFTILKCQKFKAFRQVLAGNSHRPHHLGSKNISIGSIFIFRIKSRNL